MSRSIVTLCLISFCAFGVLGVPSEGRLGLNVGRHRQSEFGEGIRDWFRGIRDRLTGRPVETNFQSKQVDDVADFDGLEFHEQSPGSFFLDLSTLTFDPDKDWGFRVGQWYFIRKVNANCNGVNNRTRYWEVPPATNTESNDESGWIELEFGKWNDSIIVSTQPESTSTELALPDSTALPTTTEVVDVQEEGDEFNETDSDSGRPEAEVVIPQNAV